MATRPRSGLVGLPQIKSAADVVGGLSVAPHWLWVRCVGGGRFKRGWGERRAACLECCARGVRGFFLPVVVPKAAPLVVLSLLFQRHRKTEVSEREGTASRIARNGASVYAAGSARTYSRRPRSTPAAAAHPVACRGRWRKAAAATTLVGGDQARPAALHEKKQKRPAKTPPPRGGRGHRRLEAEDGGGTSPHTLAGVAGLASPLRQPRPASTGQISPHWPVLERGSAGCRTRRPALGLAPRKGLPKDSDGPLSTFFSCRGGVKGTLVSCWAGPLYAATGADNTRVRLVGPCLSSGSYLWFRLESGSAVEQTLAVPARDGEQWRGLESNGVEALGERNGQGWHGGKWLQPLSQAALPSSAGTSR